MEKKSVSGSQGFEIMIHFWRIKLKPQHLSEMSKNGLVKF